MRALPVLLASLVSLTVAWAEQPATDAAKTASGPLAEANSFYQSGDFQRARTAYQAKLAEGLDGPTLLYNLGNASYRAGRIGFVIGICQSARGEVRTSPR